MSNNIPARLFEFHDGGSDKFWIIELSGTSHTVRYGRQGTDGQTKTKDFASADEAKKSYDKLVAQKVKKGYVEATAAGESRGEKLKAAEEDLKAQEPFLQEIRENPDDPGVYAVFADWLEEQGNPRGEFMNIQLQLEDESVKAAQRKQLQKREAALLKEHERDWLGDLAPYLLDQQDKDVLEYYSGKMYSHGWARGFLDSVTAHVLLPDFPKVLKRSPHIGMLRTLVVREMPGGEELTEEFEKYENEDWDYDDNPSFDAFQGAAFANLRHFEIDEDEGPSREYPSCHIRAEGVERLIKKMPRLETLILEAHEVDAEAIFKLKMPHLKSLTVNHLDDYPLDLLAKNKSLTQLESIWFYPHGLDDSDAYIQFDDLKAICRSKNLTSLKHLALYASTVGDQGAVELVESGLINRLSVLDLRYGSMSDEGAKALAAADLPDQLEIILDNNYLSKDGVAALSGTKARVCAENQYKGTPGEGDDYMEFLYMGDME